MARIELAFVTLVLNNFKSFVGGPHELPFDSYSNGVIYLKGKNRHQPRLGPNGVGKSSLWDALSWCLYGKSPSGLKNPDIKPWYGKKSSSVQVHICKNSDEHIIERTTFPNRLKLDGEDIAQENLINFLGISFEVFTNTILLAQEEKLFFSLKPSDKLDLFSDVLQLDRWEDRSRQASAKLLKLKGSYDKLDRSVEREHAILSQIKDEMEVAKKRKSRWEDDLADEIKDMKTQEKTLRVKADSCKAKLEHAETHEDMAAAELKVEKEAGKKVFDRLFELRDKRSARYEKIKAKDSQISRLNRELKDLGGTSECPMCGQSIKGTDLDKHKKHLKAQIKKLKNTLGQDKLNKLDRLYEKQEKRRDRHLEICSAFEDKIKKYRSEIDYYRPSLLEAEIKQQTMLTNIDRATNSENPYIGQVKDCMRKIKSTERKLSDLTEKRNRYARKIKRVGFWVKGFKDVRLFILREVLEELELVTNSMLVDVGLDGWSVHYAIEKETKSGSIKRGINVTIASPLHAEPVKWESWSGGESQRLRLIGALALSQVLLNHAGVEPSIEILDEPSQFLSDEGVSDLGDFLADRAKQLKRQIWYIDHHVVESTKFASVVTVCKDREGGSYVKS